MNIIRMDNTRYPKQCYYMLYHLDESGRNTWASKIKDLLSDFGFGYVWISHDVGNDREFLRIFTQRIKDCYTQKWFSLVNESSKVFHYRHFKSLLNPELYINIDLNYVLKKALSKFRCSSHELMIEKCRHLSIDRNFRFCKICEEQNINVVEDEFHFFFECQSYEFLRITYFEKKLAKHQEPTKFTFHFREW